MLFTVASSEWTAGDSLSPSETQVGLFRTREAARRMAAGRPTLALALRHDPSRGQVVAQPPALQSLRTPNGWSAPAVVNEQGGVVVFAPIPAALIQQVQAPRLKIHRGHDEAAPAPKLEALVGSSSDPGDDPACGGAGDRVR